MAKHVMQEFMQGDDHHNLDHEDIQQSLQTSKEIYKKLNKNRYYAFKKLNDGVYWTIFSLWKNFAVIITNFKVANTMKHARKQIPKSAQKIGNPSNDNDLALKIPQAILRDYKKLVEMGVFDSLDELIDTHKKVVIKYQLRN